MNDPVLSKMRASADKYGMLGRGKNVLAAVSGGADSVCLLHALGILSGERGFSLSAAHFNHCLRGEESDGDEAFTRELCGALGAPFFSGSGDVAGEAAKTGRGTEETAREMRYAFLLKTAGALGGAETATAHTADDNAETVIMNLARGGAARGLSGIPPVRGTLVRPMIAVTRAEVLAYLEKNGLPHREDSTNASDDYTRNLIRHRVIPVLKAQNPAFCEAVSQSSELLRADDEYLCSLAERFIEENLKNGRLSAPALCALPAPVAGRAIRAVCGGGLSAGHVAAVLAMAAGGCPSAKADIPGMTVRREYGDVVFGAAEEKTFEPFELEPGVTARIPAAGLRVSCERGIFSPKVHKTFNTFIFKCSDVCGKLLIRPRLSGDAAALGGRRTKTLKKLFIEKKIPAAERAAVPVLADGAGVLAAAGLGQSERSAVFDGDEIYMITFESCDKHE